MSLKSDVSSNYLDQLKHLHGNKKTEKNVRAFMSGDGRKGSIGEAIREAIIDNGGKVGSLDVDIRRSVPALRDCISHRMPDPNTLIMCHGVSHLDWFEDIPEDKIYELTLVNTTASMLLAQAFVQLTMDDQYRKTIIMIGSMAHKAVLNGSAVYCASKAGLAHFARCLAWELAPKGFDVFCIHPSNTLGTPMSEETIQGLMRYRMLSRGGAEAYWNDTQIRQESLTTPEIATLVKFLLTGEAQYLAGSQLELAGGQR